MSIDTEMPQRKSEAPHVEQQQELADVCWRPVIASSSPGPACYPGAIPASLEF